MWEYALQYILVMVFLALAVHRVEADCKELEKKKAFSEGAEKI